MDGVPASLLSSAGLPAVGVIGWMLVAAFVRAIMKGQLVVRWVYQEKAKQADTWQRIAETRLDKIERVAIPAAELQRSVFQSLPQQAPPSEGQG